MGNIEIPKWLQKLPLAPTFYPTDTEFADPIAYISKIEKEASAFGICKVIPPLPKPSKKYVFSNLNKSLLRAPELDSFSSQMSFGDKDKQKSGDHQPVFTTRHQELGCTSKKPKGDASIQQSVVHKQVWQSGEVYTLEQFESKAKVFARNQLGMIKDVTPLDVEALFWKAASENPIYIEYANDVPGSGFGEPEEVCQYFHRRRRRRQQFNQNHKESPDHEKQNTDTLSDSYTDRERMNKLNLTCEALKSSDSMSEESSRSLKQKGSTIGIDGEGTAGWKLSNSPWNLQVIARSPGSLTRFMLDDIPGVTSPMIYVGMLYSWFAWHVEDHELHSLNFLHTGSPKTWYAVPGDYAFHFEDVIRSEGYGGNLDRLAALTLLGEKTNLLSPEVVIASGIPCCRLVQSPGEFVVTFPRAYHIGFSHGFNCGEAANFGTPQWLKVAKAAAVRRAAMNYLPMLSHQQLLYMLTMSFVSRVPKTLLLGARSSRLKDRQKEQRELLVKRAFIDDMLNEKHLLSVLGKKSSFSAVLWDPEALPSPECVLNEPSTVSAMSIERCFGGYQYNDSSSSHDCLTRPPMESLQDIYANEDELPCGLHVDSGILPCVACGVLGFPFMSIVQPSRRAVETLFPEVCRVSQGLNFLGSIKSNGHKDLYDASVKFASDASWNCDENQNVSGMCRTNVRLTEEEATTTSSEDKKWNTSSKFLRPRVFCLEHAFEVEELFHSKGGANLLIICHAAYQKINAHALAVAEEIGVCLDRDEEVPLQFASKEDIDLITIAMDGDDRGHEETTAEDWTSKLGLNLRYCAKLKKLCPSKDEQQYALAFGGLFCEPGSLDDHLQWKSRRSRTPCNNKTAADGPPSQSKQVEKVERRNGAASGESEVKIYSRRSCKGSSSSSRFTHSNNNVLDHLSNNKEGVIVNLTSLGDPPELSKSEMLQCTNTLEKKGIQDITCVEEAQTCEEQVNDVDSSQVQPQHECNLQSELSIKSPPPPPKEEDESEEEEIEKSVSSHSERRRRKRGSEDENSISNYSQNGFIKSPCEGLRPRKQAMVFSSGREAAAAGGRKKKSKSESEGKERCDIDGCGMSFKTKEELSTHKQNQCPHKGCGKEFKSHKYALLHQRVHADERPLKCSWKGCTMSFKWAWARTEHMRVHTGERPYKCNHPGCPLTFRFVSDLSRHRRKTGHRQ